MGDEWNRFSNELKGLERKVQGQIVALRTDMIGVSRDAVEEAMSIEIREIISESILDYKSELKEALAMLNSAKNEAEVAIRKLHDFDAKHYREHVNCTLRY